MKRVLIWFIILLSLYVYADSFSENCRLVSFNHQNKLKTLVSNVKEVMQTDKNGRTLLYCASESGSYKSVSLLLKNGLDPNIRNDKNLTAMNVLLEKESMYRGGELRYDFMKTMMLLLQYGADINTVDQYGHSLLMHAYSPRIVRMLLAYGADVNKTNNQGENALFYFAKFGHQDEETGLNLKLLLEYGADPKVKDKKGKLVFDYLHGDNKYNFYKETHYPKVLEAKILEKFLIQAIDNNDYEMIGILLKMGDFANAKNMYNRQPIILQGITDSRIIDLFFKNGLDDNITFNPYSPKSLLYVALEKCALDSARVIVEHNPKSLHEFYTTAGLIRCKDTNKSMQIMDMLIKKGLDISMQDQQGHTLLHLAAKRSKKLLCQYLVDKGVDVNSKDKEGATPLIYAVNAREKDDCTQILLKAGANIHVKMPNNITLLHVSVKRDKLNVTKALLNQGFDPNETDTKKHNVLELAAKNGNLDMFKLLLEKGANINAIDEDGDSVLHYACGWDNSTEMAKFILEKGIDVNIKNKKGQTPLFRATKNNNLDVVFYLINHQAEVNTQDKQGNTPLHIAVKKANKKMMVLLLLKGVDQSLKNGEGLTALDLVNKEHKYDKEKYQKILNKDFQDTLLNGQNIFSLKSLDDLVLYVANGGDLHIKGDKGESLLHLAVETLRNNESVVYLLQEGIDVNVQNSSGQTALHLASKNSNAELIHTLLVNGAKVNLKDNNNLAPIDYVMGKVWKKRNDLQVILKDMLAHGLLNIPWKNMKGKLILNEIVENSELISFLIGHGANVNAVDKDGDTALMACAVHNYPQSAKILLAAGAKIDMQDNRGRTALYTSTVLHSYEAAEILLKNGANVNLKTKVGSTPIMNAFSQNDERMVSLLLEYKADPNSRNKDKMTLLHLAVLNGDENLAKELLKYKANPNLRDDLGLTALDYAKRLRLKSVINLLEPITQKRNNSLIRDEIKKRLSPQESKSDIVQKVDKNVLKYGQSKLHQAVSSKNEKLVCALLENGAKIDVVDKLGRTPLHYAVILRDIKIAQLLLDKGADVNKRDNTKQWTPLFYATFMKYPEMVKLLIKKGADVTLKDKFNRTVNNYDKK